jgi:hypothetical protein
MKFKKIIEGRHHVPAGQMSLVYVRALSGFLKLDDRKTFDETTTQAKARIHVVPPQRKTGPPPTWLGTCASGGPPFTHSDRQRDVGDFLRFTGA